MENETETLAIRIEKLKVSEPVISTGLEYDELYELSNRAAEPGFTYYDHAITPIEKMKLLRSIDEIKRPFASKESSDDGEQVSDVLSHCKDKRLISILQGNS